MSTLTFSSREKVAVSLEKWLIKERANVLLYGMFGVGKTQFIQDFKQRGDIKSQCEVLWPHIKDAANSSEFWSVLLRSLSIKATIDPEIGYYRSLRANLKNLEQKKRLCVFVLDDFNMLVEKLSDTDLSDVMTQLFMLQSVEMLNVVFIIVASTRAAFLLLDKNERYGIYQVFKKNVPHSIGLCPLSVEETKQLALETLPSLSPPKLENLAIQSGGHVGLLEYLISSVDPNTRSTPQVEDYLGKIWASLNDGVQEALQHLVYENLSEAMPTNAQKWLQSENGLIGLDGRVFSLLFEDYIRSHTISIHSGQPRVNSTHNNQLTTLRRGVSRIKVISHDWSFSLMLFLLWFVPVAVTLVTVSQTSWTTLILSAAIGLALVIACALLEWWPGPRRTKQVTTLWTMLTLYYASATVFLFFSLSLWFIITFLGMAFTGLVLWRIIDWRRGDL